MKKSIIYFLIFIGLIINLAQAQNLELPLNLTLIDVIDLAKEQSPSIKYYQNRNVNSYWRYKNFKARFLPQLSISGDIPNYEQGNRAVEQNNGSIEFRHISQLRAETTLAMSQYIPLTGAVISGTSSLDRVEDFINNSVVYSGVPFSLNFYQPLFAYNWMKWYKKTEPLVYEESKKRYVESVERVSLNATTRFFNYLRIQTNFSLATSSLRNSEDNLKIAEVKKRLGQISENDFSRIRLSVLNAKKALSKSEMDLKNADFSLKSYIGMDQNTNIKLIVPLDMSLFVIDSDKALAETLENRKETPEFKRRLIEADRNLVSAKRNTGLSTVLRGSYGTSNSSAMLPGIYNDTDKQQTLRLTMNIPILDWGKAASAVKLAESSRELQIYGVEREKIDFERGVIVQVEQFNLLRDQMETANEADKVAGNGYQISLKKFQNGEISITDLNISLAEREKAKRDYITSLADYWQSFYTLRILTLYDFELNQKISYSNPSLSIK